MAKQPKQFPIYETLLHLYPKAFHDEYSGEMVQTLTDMLADRHDKYERTAIWLRVAGELPLSIMHETINNLGGTTMHKLTKISNKQLLIVGAILLVLVMVGISTVGRKPVMSAVATVLYSKSVQQTLTSQDNVLGKPFKLFAINIPKSNNVCDVSVMSGISTQVECTASVQGYTKLGETEQDKQKNTQKVQTLEAALQKEAYKSGSNGVTITSLVTGTYEGKDYSADAFYQKITGPYTCTFDMSIAYGNPAPKAINMVMSCIRTKDILGTPNDAVFQSSQGFQM